MKRLIIILAAVWLVACGESPQEQAELLARQAAECCEDGRLDEARTLIDSLRRTFPDIVEARKAALRLHQDVELKIAQQELARTDSVLVVVNRQLDSLQQQVDAHKAALKALGLEGDYEALDTPPEDLVSRVKFLKAEDFNGFNVTIPHKVAITLFVEQFDEWANLSGAVNTVKIMPDKVLQIIRYAFQER